MSASVHSESQMSFLFSFEPSAPSKKVQRKRSTRRVSLKPRAFKDSEANSVAYYDNDNFSAWSLDEVAGEIRSLTGYDH